MFMNFLKAKNDFIQAAQRTYTSGIQTGTGGNLSVRIPGTDYMIVKPSGFSYGQCSEENLVITDFDGHVIEGALKPTQESVLHGKLYRNYPHIGGIVHTHSPYSIMSSLKFKQIDAITMHCMLKLKGPIPVIDIETQTVTEEEFLKIEKAFNDQIDLQTFILKGHGIVSVNKTAVKAGEIAELVEETAQIFWNINLINK